MNGRRSALILGFVVAILLVSGPARAQDKPHNAFAMGYPAAAGVLWNISDRVALWPELGEVGHSSSATNTLGVSSVNDAFGADLRVLLYLAPAGAFRPYVVPEFDYTRTHTIQSTALATTVSSYGAAASFGAQYAMSPRFGVFGEVGLRYLHEKETGFIGSSGSSSGTRNAVGVLVFF